MNYSFSMQMWVWLEAVIRHQPTNEESEREKKALGYTLHIKQTFYDQKKNSNCISAYNGVETCESY